MAAVRLALLAADAEQVLWQAVQARLHRATLTHVAAADVEACVAEFDAIVIAVDADREQLTRIARAGKPIFLLGPHPPDVATLAANVPIVVGRPLRFRPAVAAVKSALAGGQLGAPALVRLHHWEPRGAAELGAALDLIHWLVGDLPAQVFAVGHRSVAAYLQVHLGFAAGGMALIDLAPLADGPGYFSLSVIGRTGAAYADDHHNSHLAFRGGAPAALLADIPASGPLALVLDDFAATVRSPAPAAALRAVGQVQAAVNASLAAGQPVTLAGGRYEVVA